MCLQNTAKSDELLDALVHEAIAAACGRSDESSASRGKWTQYGLQLEALVRYVSTVVFSSQVIITMRVLSSIQMRMNRQTFQDGSVKLIGWQQSTTAGNVYAIL